MKIIRYMFVLLVGLVFGFVVRECTGLVSAVDNFEGSSGNAGFMAYGR